MGIAALLIAGMLAFEDPPKDVVDFFRTLSSALADADRDLGAKESNQPRGAKEFLGYFDKSMPGYVQFSDQIEAIVGAGEVASTLDFVNTEGNDQKRTLDLDWILQCEGERPKRAVIKCTIEKRGKKWKVTSIAPIEFFKRE